MGLVRIAVIQFPGTNCEYETQRAVASSGAVVDIVSWQLPVAELRAYDGVVIAGGFSFQDRVRAGAIAAKLPIMDGVRAMAEAGKPVLGICNGCQVLAEAGLIPMLEETRVDVAMAHNTRDGHPVGFICDWVYVRVQSSQNIFLQGLENQVLPIPINHGEGRFVLNDKAVAALSSLGSVFYCDPTGAVDGSFPTNPNGAHANLAGLGNLQGNVLAIMPHPERANFLKQIPTWIDGDWSAKKRSDKDALLDSPGPWSVLFQNMVTYCQQRGGQ
jgi:phosphoribosylformylglycinamidine synthase subunit PurQ / glutaminase